VTALDKIANLLLRRWIPMKFSIRDKNKCPF